MFRFQMIEFNVVGQHGKTQSYMFLGIYWCCQAHFSRHVNFFQGTRDLTPYLCVEEALDFYQEIGGAPAIARHAEELLDFGEKLFKDYFDVASAPFPKSMRAPYMRIIGEPNYPY